MPQGVTLDFEKRNKELYIARGRQKDPVWLGYNKNMGMMGVFVESQRKKARKKICLLNLNHLLGLTMQLVP